MKEATSVKIVYTVDGERKEVTCNEADELKKLLGALKVSSTRNNSFIRLLPMCIVHFVPAEGPAIEVMFGKPDFLHEKREDGGKDYFLKNSEFYDVVNEIASKAEGRKIDVLGFNMTYGVGRLKDHSATKIIYTVAHKKKEITVEPVQSITLLGDISDGSHKKVDQRELKPMGLIRYIASDGESIDKAFVTSKQLYEKLDRGAVDYTLNNTKFYDKVNEVLSKAEGRKIDVLKDN